ncbi:MAG: hypothetical protein M3O55_12400 [Actinomycetota bacterium]|nr:hypothetical protein [Actinomycetota bacterium]
MSRSRGRPAAAHAIRPAAVAPVAVIHDVVRRMMQEAPPALDVFAAEAALATFPLLLIVLMLVGFTLVQRLIDRGDPKLASNAKPDPLLPFT